jgi:hypothetical protein
VSTYLEFARDVIPRAADMGYNAIQLMAVQEHAFYGSFGYHVTNFFAVRPSVVTSQRFPVVWLAELSLSHTHSLTPLSCEKKARPRLTLGIRLISTFLIRLRV